MDLTWINVHPHNLRKFRGFDVNLT